MTNQPQQAKERTMKPATRIEPGGRTGTPRIEDEAEIVHEYGPFGEGGVHGVTFDGKLVWFARDNELVAFDPETEKVVRRHAVPADAGTAFDGENLYQLAEAEILVIRPADGRIL